MTGRPMVLVTGAGGGIGRAICRQLAEDGFALLAQDLSEPALALLVDELAGVEIGTVAFDIADGSAAAEALASRRIDHLVHAAGVDHTPGDGSETASDPLLALTHMGAEAWRQMQAIHVDGAFHCTQALVRDLLARQARGSAVYLSSITGTAGFGPVHYATAKAALLGLAKAVARSGAVHGIRANAIAPGMVDSPMTEKLPPAFLDGMRAATPLGRLGRPEEIAGTVSYLLSPAADFLTGQVISPNGGLVIA